MSKINSIGKKVYHLFLLRKSCRDYKRYKCEDAEYNIRGGQEELSNSGGLNKIQNSPSMSFKNYELCRKSTVK